MQKSNIAIPVPTEGINTIEAAFIAPNEAAFGTKNMSFKNGIPATRKGYVKSCTHNFTTEAHTLINYVKSGTRIVLAAAGTGLLKQTSGTAFTAITGTLASDNVCALTYPFNFGGADTYGDKCFLFDGTNYRYYYDNGTLTDVPAYTPTSPEQTTYGVNVLSTAPDEVKKQKWVILDNERLWVAGYNKIVRLSHLSRPDYFPSNQVWKLSEDCTGIVQFSDEVIMFTEHTATLIKGSTPNWELPDKYVKKSLPVNYGCSQHRSIAKGGGALYWASRGGVFRYMQLPDGTYEPQCISEIEVKRGSKKHIKSVQYYIKSVTDWTKVYAVFYDNEYRICLGDTRWLVWDSIGNTWAYYEYDKIFNHAITYQDTLYAVKSYSYQLDKTYDKAVSADGLSDDGVAIQSTLKSGIIDLEKSANKKKFKTLYFTLFSDLVSYDLDLTLWFDSESLIVTDQIINTVSIIGTLKFGDILNVSNTNLNHEIKVRHKGTKYNMQYQLQCNDLNAAFALTDLVLYVKIKELS